MRIWCTVPPRHGKSETLLHGIAWALQGNPKLPILYATHTATFAAKQSRRARRLAAQVGAGPAEGANRADEWETTAGGGLVARGVGGEVTGRGFGLIVVDDPLKGREAAESAVQRQAIWEWLCADIFSRATPGGSILVVHTRWHPDDPIGHLVREGWPGIMLRAIAEPGDERPEGTPLWPAGGWTEQVLGERRAEVGAYNWASLYQGRPRPRGGTVFGEPHWCDALPTHGYACGYGADLAYTAKTSADWSVCVRLLRVGDTYYVADVRRKQVDAPGFTIILRAMVGEVPGRILWHCSGTERGAADFIHRSVPQLQAVQVKADKFTRAQAVAAAWNAGKILLPRGASWSDTFIGEVCSFTGVSDDHDDQVDALASAHTGLQQRVGGGFRELQRISGEMPQWRV